MRWVVEDKWNSVGNLGRPVEVVDCLFVRQRPPIRQDDLNGSGTQCSCAPDTIQHDHWIGLTGADDEGHARFSAALGQH